MSKVSLYISPGEVFRVLSSLFYFKVKYLVLLSCIKTLSQFRGFCRTRSVVVNDALKRMWTNGSRSLFCVMSLRFIAWADQHNSSNLQALRNILQHIF
jgi:hypothetical protein